MDKLVNLPISHIYVPVKRRGAFDSDLIRQIAESILELGQQTPILVRRDGERFVLIDGLHRLEACKALGEQTILGVFVSSTARYPKVSPAYEAEVEVLRQRTARLRELRLAKEAAERSSCSDSEQARDKQPPTPRRPRRSGNSDRKSPSLRPTTLSEWLAERERDGTRT